MGERKTLAGVARWTIDDHGSVANLAVPVTTHGIVGGLTFYATALVYEPVQSGSCVLVLEQRPLQRFSFRPTHAHLNPFGPGVSPHLRGLRLPAGKSRIYPWSENRTWPRPKGDNASVAQPMDVDMGSLDLMLALFLQLCDIDGDLPCAPWEPRLL